MLIDRKMGLATTGWTTSLELEKSIQKLSPSFLPWSFLFDEKIWNILIFLLTNK